MADRGAASRLFRSFCIGAILAGIVAAVVLVASRLQRAERDRAAQHEAPAE